MPDRTLNQAIEAFQEGVSHIDELAAQVESLAESNERIKRYHKRLTILTLTLIAVIFSMIGLGCWMYFNDREHDRQLVDAAQQSIEVACRARNSSTRSFNLVFHQLLDALDRQSPEESPVIEDLREVLRESEANAVVDCNRDGVTNDKDFSQQDPQQGE
jgi:hypothetical protein